MRQVSFKKALFCWFLFLSGLTPGYTNQLYRSWDPGPSICTRSDTAFNLFENLPVTYFVNSFKGYNCAEFMFEGRACKLVQPEKAAPGRPWIWRARFWGHEPQTDSALLANGFHVAYCDVSELFGNNEAILIWNKFYELVTTAGLASKVVLEGMSRGGVYAMNWAAENPDKVACVYLDNPVLDLKSWPGGLGRIPNTQHHAAREALLKSYNLKDSSALLSFRGSPIDKTDKIAAGKYPILILCADKDEVVAPEENTYLFEQLMKGLNADIKVIHKKGYKHHPHSFPDPTVIVGFILSHTLRGLDGL